MSTKFLSPGWRMPRNANQSKSSNYSLDFDSTGSNYIDLGNTDALKLGAEDFTFSAWINPDSWGSGFEAIYANVGTNGVLIGKDNAGNFVLRIYYVSNIITYSTLPTVGAWTHICITRDNGQCSLFYNGYSVATATSTHNFNASANVFIGSDNGGGDFNGQIDQVSIFDYALSASQVTTLWGGGTSVSNPMALPSPPIAYYPLGTSAWNGEYLAENNAIGDYVFDFNGSNGYVDYGYTALTAISGGSSTLTTSMTISIWFKLNNATSEKGLIYFGDLSNNYGGFTIRHYASKFNFLRGSSHIITGGYSFTDTTSWHNMTLVYDPTNASNCYLYIDGSDTGATFNASVGNIDFLNSNLSQRSLIIGTYYNTSYIFNGEMSNVQIFDTALSSTEVETLYNYGSPIKTLANIPQSSNLKAWYKLDASEVYNSTTTEWSIDNNQNPSAYPSSLDFNGSSDYIDVGTPSTFAFGTGDFTIGGWVYLDSSTNYQWLFSTGTNFAFGFDSSRNLQLWVGGTATTPSFNINLNQWHHILATRNSGTVTFYIDGSAFGTTYSRTGSIAAGSYNYIGTFNINQNHLDGRISNFQLFNTALPATGSNSVETLYNNGSPLTSMSGFTSLVSWYKLNNTTTGIEDAKGSNNGTNNGATEYPGFVNTLAGDSSGMSQANLIQSDLQTVAPYSKYAMEFDSLSTTYVNVGSDSSLNLTSQMSVSIWAKPTGTAEDVYGIISNFPQTYKFTFEYYRANTVTARTLRLRVNPSNGVLPGYLLTYVDLSDGDWHHLAFTVDGTTNANGINVYVDGAKLGSFTATNPGINSNNSPTIIGNYQTGSTWDFDGYLSNASIWDTALTESQIIEIYNEGLPGNLNSHSAYSNLVSWWQLGENSSFDGNNWIVADEKGTNNGTSSNMGVGALVNGVGTTANGLSSGMSEGNLVGDAPYSTANAISTNMVVTSRVSGSGNTP